MRRTLSYILAAAGVVLVGACSDSSLPTRAIAPRAIASLDAASAGPSFVIGRDAGTTSAGMFDLRWSANAVACVGDPCVAPTGPVTITTQVRSNSGRHWVMFSPHVEFAPGSTVVLSTGVYKGVIGSLLARGYTATDPIWQGFSIQSTSDITELGTADGTTTVDLSTGVVSRAITHFSGYVVTSGRACDASTDVACTADSTTVIIQ